MLLNSDTRNRSTVTGLASHNSKRSAQGNIDFTPQGLHLFYPLEQAAQRNNVAVLCKDGVGRAVIVKDNNAYFTEATLIVSTNPNPRIQNMRNHRCVAGLLTATKQ